MREERTYETAAGAAVFAAIVRRANRDDADTLYMLINLAYRTERRLLPGPRILKTDLYAELADRANVFIVAETDGHIVGTIRVRVEEGPAYGPRSPFFGLFAVAPQCQHNGVGRRLIAAAEEVVRASGLGEIHLQCAREMGMCGYYEALGYRAIEEDFGPHGNCVQIFTLVTMRKDLRQARGGSNLNPPNPEKSDAKEV